MSEMTQSRWIWGRQFLGSLLVMGGAIAFSGKYALAQITSDNTLGAGNSRVTTLPGNFYLIQGGATRGTNLFHSFDQFSVPTNGIAYFNNALAIKNIISRVTSSSVSNIDGLIAANGKANLFLVNPNGIIFGPNAQLMLDGSFLASTASSLLFPNAYQFSATNPQAPPLLTINVPIGLQFGETPGRIVNQSRTRGFGIFVPTDKTLALVGGDVALEGGLIAAGRIELGSVAGNSLVSLNPIDKGWDLGYVGVQNFQDIQLSQGAYVSTSSSVGSGDIQVQGRRITLTEGSVFAVATFGSQPAGNITLKASESVELIGTTADGSIQSGLLAEVRPGATGAGGNLTINTRQLIVRDGAVVSAGTGGIGQGGNITVNASESVEVSGTQADGRSPSGLFAASVSADSGNSGNISIRTGQVTIRDGAVVATSTKGLGQGGNVTVTARDSVELIGTSVSGQSPTGITTQTATGIGNAGDITISTPQLILKDGATVAADTRGAGQGGNVIVKDANFVELIGTSEAKNPSSVFPSSILIRTTSSGNAGNLSIDTKTLLIRDGARVFADTSGSGRAGTLAVNADSVEVIGTSASGRAVSGLYFDTSSGGNAGDLRINTGQLVIRDGATVSASTSDQGQGGTLAVNANTVVVSGISNDGQNPSRLFFDSSGGGDAGELTIAARRLIVRDGGQVSAATSSTGKGGILAVDVSDSVVVSGTNGQFASGLYFDSRSQGNARGISINTGNLTVQNGGQVSVSGTGTGTAGDLEVRANSVVLNNQGKLTASTIDGQGGTVNVTAPESVNVSSGSSILAQATGNGSAGSVRILTDQLTVRDGSQVAVSSAGSGTAGNLEVTANSVGLDNQAKLSAETDSGSGGNIQLQGLNSLTLSNKSEVSASTVDGQGGTVDVNASDFVDLSNGGGLFARATGKGSAGSLRITTNQLTLQDGAQASVSNTGSGTTGNLEVKAGSIFMNNQGNLTAKTVSGEGGNIQLQVANTVLLRHNSNILTEALGSGNGGNININAGGFVLAILPENSDVAATAIQGRGGNIFVTARGVFGFSLPERLVRTPDSDISAASQLGINGTREINTRDKLQFPLPSNVGAPPPIAQGCQVTDTEHTNSQFIITGRGGLPPNPSEALRTETVLINGVVPQPEVENHLAEETSKLATRSTPGQLVEAQGWVYNSKGQVVLTSQASTVTPYGPPRFNPKNCNVP